ncbi:MAG: hypothetical protein M1829_006564 [Trizodia sp. TS-e1964]|nr:MAG: hypothetical protein M1829_006564 [Trizodia sp. TS-e1964]
MFESYDEASEMDQLLYTLALTRHNAPSNTPKSDNTSGAQKKLTRKSRLSLFQAVALLLLSEPKGHVVAVTSITTSIGQGQVKMEFLYAKNEASKGGAKITRKKAAIKICHLAIAYCDRKMKKRFDKLQSAWMEASTLPADIVLEPRSSATPSSHPSIKKQQLQPDDFVAYLTSWFNSLDEFEPVKILCDSFRITNSRAIFETIRDMKLRKRLRKVSDYIRSIRHIVKLIASKPKTSIAISEIAAASPVFLLYNNDPIETINIVAKEFKEKISLNSENFKAVAPHCDEMVRPTKLVKHITHCECHLAMNVIPRRSKNSVIEIGISKNSCWPCATFMDALMLLAEPSSMQCKNLRAHHGHGKTYSGWMIPRMEEVLSAKEIEDVTNRMIEATKGRLLSMIKAYLSQRVSDSSGIMTPQSVETDESDTRIGFDVEY